MAFKQNSLHPAPALWSRVWLSLILCFSCIYGWAAAQPAAGTAAQDTRLRLVAAPGLHHGTYGAGLEIAMPSGSHTYWKMPGDAGVPPVFSFAGSRNVAEARVLYPTPRRITEAGLEAFGYVDHVTFPIVVKPANPKEPAVLTADVSYAVCDKVCTPVHATSSVDLTPGSAATGDAIAVDAAFAAVPAPASPSERAELALTRVPGAGKPTWTLTWHGAEPVEDVFADAPQGFYFSTRRQNPSTWSLVAEEALDSKAAASVAVALTVARPAHPFVVEEKLDLASATR